MKARESIVPIPGHPWWIQGAETPRPILVGHQRPLAIHQGDRRWYRAFNDTPDLNSQILWHDLPTQMHPGQVLDVSVTVRNMGDISWTGAQLYQFGQEGFRPGEVLFGSGSYLIVDSQNGIPGPVAFFAGSRSRSPFS